MSDAPATPGAGGSTTAATTPAPQNGAAGAQAPAEAAQTKTETPTQAAKRYLADLGDGEKEYSSEELRALRPAYRG